MVGYVDRVAHLLTALDFRNPILMTVFGGRHNYLETLSCQLVYYCSNFELRRYF